MRSELQNKLQGGKNRSAGKLFEAMISKSFEYYRKGGIAIIDKTPEPMRPIRNMGNGHFECVFEHKAQPDYKGILRGGQSFVCETKCTQNAKLHKDVVTRWQAAYLNEARDFGAWCFVIVGFFSSGICNVYKIPWEIWDCMEDYFGRKYVTETDLQQYKIEKRFDRYLLLKDGY